MTIGVEGAPTGELDNYIGTHSRGEDETLKYVTMDGEQYIEIDTHRLKSIEVKARYADGTEYVANSEINRNLMLLVKASDWEAAKVTSVTGINNEAIYSGVLSDYSSTVAAGLSKVGAGALVLDQLNKYSGDTQVKEGTLWLRGWGSVGSGKAIVEDGASLMFSYTLGYGDEKPEIANRFDAVLGNDECDCTESTERRKLHQETERCKKCGRERFKPT
jgi:autotransporter-associated beta strand protein